MDAFEFTLRTVLFSIGIVLALVLWHWLPLILSLIALVGARR